MKTLLQRLFSTTQSASLDPVVCAYIETVLLAMEKVFGVSTVISGAEEPTSDLFQHQGSTFAAARAESYTRCPKQSLLVYVLNSLLIVWSLLPSLSSVLTLSCHEKRILCLGLSLYRYRMCNKGVLLSPETACLEECRTIGNQLNFDAFWADWHEYLSEIVYLTQIIQPNSNKTVLAKQTDFKIPEHRLHLPLCLLLEFGTIAAQLSNPADIVTQLAGQSLQAHLKSLGIQRQLVYHHTRACTGLLTQSIHNAVIQFVQALDWQPIFFFAQGVIYLAPENNELPDRAELQTFLWQQISDRLASRMLQGKVGFKRDGKGLKAAPQALELVSPTQLIRNLPHIIETRVRNAENPATPKRLEKLNLSPTERKFLEQGADLRADRLAEFIILIQQKFFRNRPKFIAWMLEKLKIQSDFTLEQTQRQSGGVNLGWYHAAAYYFATNPALDCSKMLQELAQQLSSWAEDNHLLPVHHSPTRGIFYDYLTQYLEIQGWDVPELSFERELAGYVNAKTNAAKQPICSLSSGEFPSEDQLDSVVLFKPQQYSNKNPLGGRQIKRGISKIWSLEMLLRQASWPVPAGKLEDQHPVFLYIYPFHFYSPQMAAVIQRLIQDIRHVNLWNVCRHWQTNGMDAQSLRSFPWLESTREYSGTSLNPEHVENDFPFVAMTYTTTKDKTSTDAWVKPVFLALALPLLLGCKVVATSSSVPPHDNRNNFQESVQLDGAAGFWQALNFPTSLYLQNWIDGRVQSLADVLNRVLLAYSVHLDTRSNPPDARWKALEGTVRDMTVDVLNIFLLAQEGLRRDHGGHEPTAKELQRYWQYVEIWAEGDGEMQSKLMVTKQLACECRKFYRVDPYKSTHAILLPFSKALEHILSVPADWDDEEIINQGQGLIQAALNRQEIYKRPLLKDTSVDYTVRHLQEMNAIHTFMTTCVKQVFRDMCQGDRALLQENRNRLKAGVEFAYRELALQEKYTKASKQGDEDECS